MIDRDLFGEPCSPQPDRRRRNAGYAAPPGSGPKGETCRTCLHFTRIRYAGTYRKCGLMRQHWTHGQGTDILARAPACNRWEKPDE